VGVRVRSIAFGLGTAGMPTIVRRKQRIKQGSDRITTKTCRDTETEETIKFKSKDEIIQEMDSAIRTVNKGIEKIVSQHRARSIAGDGGLVTKIYRRLQERILPHMKHCLVALQQQLNALQIGLEVFQSKLLPIIHKSIQSYVQSIVRVLLQQQSNKNERKALLYQCRQNIVHALQHIFYWLLHLHDGYIFTISGECRHAVDQTHAKQTKFKSHLNSQRYLNSSAKGDTQKPSENLSTQLYSTEHIYSGTSWDEYMDSANGLRLRLLKSIVQLKHGGTNASTLGDKLESLWEDWTYEVTQPGFLLESIITKVETQMLHIQSQFTNLSTKLLTKTLQNAFHSSDYSISTTVALNWYDKMESLRIASSIFNDVDGPQNHVVQFERYADDFQIHSTGGVLPLHFTTEDHWWQDGGMKFDIAPIIHPNQALTKRRRIIVERDDNSTSDQEYVEKKTEFRESKPAVLSGGLIVKLIEQKPSDFISHKSTTNAEINNCSVNEIKMHFGVDVQSREAAFDGLQAEEDVASREAYIIDHTPVVDIQEHSEKNDIDIIYDEMQEAENRIKHAKLAFRRTLDSAMKMNVDSQTSLELNSVDINIWNAREVFREALMHGGDVLLWSVGRISDLGVCEDPFRILQKAIQRFSTARDLVLKQQKLHESMNADLIASLRPNVGMYSSFCFFRRNLMLLLGQAEVNIGIGHIELARQTYQNESDPVRKQEFCKACDELDSSICTSEAMHSQALSDMASLSFVNESIWLDRLKAQQLESLALRWKATALWYLFKKVDSFQTIQKAAEVIDESLISSVWIDLSQSKSPSLSEDQNILVEAIIELRLELYYCWTTLADLASQSLERATVASIRESMQQGSSFYDTLTNYVEQGMTNAASISQVLCDELQKASLSAKYAECCTQEMLIPSPTILQSLKDIREWWKRRQRVATEMTTTMWREESNEKSTIPRSDLFSMGKEEWEAFPTQSFVLQPKTRRSKFNLGGTDAHTKNATNKRAGAATVRERQGSDVPNIQPPSYATQKFRKWREDMIPDPFTGRLIPQLVYPSIAPPMPEHIQRILVAKHGTTSTSTYSYSYR
jgi:hypothetical protein